jgi:hypothetical protein
VEGTSPLKVVVDAREEGGGSLSGNQRHERSIEGDMDETVGGDGLLDTLDKAILPEEFPRISPSEPGKRRSGSGIWERNRKGY